jgi:hypothetical protein
MRHRFVEPSGTVTLITEDGQIVELPVVPGILKHLAASQLKEALRDPRVARKYTHEALRKAPWSAVRHFPRGWLVARMEDAQLPEGRRRALELLLGDGHALRG